MRAKVLMSPCYAEKFHQENHDYVKTFCHFHVCSCKQHLFFASRADHMELRCTYPDIEKNKICYICVEVKYLLNFRAFKICMNKVSESFQEHLVQLPDYLDGVFPCDPFF